ncbi:hypothetical protein ACFUOZ_20815 [Paenarthrobacter sp. NPDC057355]|uniref:hypothetical protein n=1 Tax=Paenarthrobacter sp. NPDC057355 TaxID=3346105 RepID=UPI00362DE341
MNRWKELSLVLAVSALAVSGCSTASNTEPIPGATAEDHGPGEHYHNVPEVTWDAKSEESVKAVAVKVMGMFARPNVPERQWYTDIFPHLSKEYAVDAQYIDPARIRVNAIQSGPVLTREMGNPMTVTAEFATNNGPWLMLLHRLDQHEPWLVTSIAPKDS